MMIKALIFDFDGLIIDTETPSYCAFRQLYNEYDVDLSLESYSQCIGTSFSIFNPYTYLSKILDREIEYEVIRNRFNEIYSALLKREELRPGVLDYLESAVKLGLKIGLASSSTIGWIQPHLDRFELNHYFSSVMTADKVFKVKPDPELYVTSLKNLNVTGTEAISFEDSLNGLSAARSAGVNCVVVPNEVTQHLEFTGNILKISSMKELSLERIIEQMNLNESRI